MGGGKLNFCKKPCNRTLQSWPFDRRARISGCFMCALMDYCKSVIVEEEEVATCPGGL